MEKFKKFKINNQKMINGGEIIESVVISSKKGLVGKDLYDTERDRWIDIVN